MNQRISNPKPLQELQQEYMQELMKSYRNSIKKISIEGAQYMVTFGIIKTLVINQQCQLILAVHDHNTHFLGFALQTKGFPYDKMSHPIFKEKLVITRMNKVTVEDRNLCVEFDGSKFHWRIEFSKESIAQQWRRYLNQLKDNGVKGYSHALEVNKQVIIESPLTLRAQKKRSKRLPSNQNEYANSLKSPSLAQKASSRNNSDKFVQKSPKIFQTNLDLTNKPSSGKSISPEEEAKDEAIQKLANDLIVQRSKNYQLNEEMSNLKKQLANQKLSEMPKEGVFDNVVKTLQSNLTKKLQTIKSLSEQNQQLKGMVKNKDTRKKGWNQLWNQE